MLAYLQASGYEPVRAGSGYKLRQDPSIYVYPATNTFKDYGKTQAQGDIIDFVRVFENKSFREAIASLTGGEFRTKSFEAKAMPPPKPFALPEPAMHFRNAVNYLKHRGINPSVIQHCVDRGLIYESEKYHNAVYVGKDASGTAKFAAVEQTTLHPKEKRFKSDVSGSQKAYSFSVTPERKSTVLGVYESPIDALSHATLRQAWGKPWQDYHYLSLGGVSPKALDRYLQDHPEVKTVGLCLDNDEAGRKASEGYKAQLEVLGYAVIDAPPQQGKDYNDWCQAEKVQQHAPTSKKKSQTER